MRLRQETEDCGFTDLYFPDWTLPPESVVLRSHLMVLVLLLLEVFQSLLLRHQLLLLHFYLLLLPRCHFSQLFHTEALLQVHLTLGPSGPIVHLGLTSVTQRSLTPRPRIAFQVLKLLVSQSLVGACSLVFRKLTGQR